MQDRVSLYPGRVTLTPVAGQANTYDLVRADQPTQEGTPLNKANLLSDATAALYGLGTDAVPDDVLAAIKTFLGSVETLAESKAQIEPGSYTGTGTYGSSNPCTLTFAGKPMMLFVCGGSYQFFEVRGYTFAVAYGMQQRDASEDVTWGDSSVKWNNSESAHMQLNTSGAPYYYVAITK